MAAFDAGDDRAHGHAHERARPAAAGLFGAGDDARARPRARARVRRGVRVRRQTPRRPRPAATTSAGPARDTFAGARAGFCFTTGRLGTGYYRDRDPARPHACGCGSAFDAQGTRAGAESPVPDAAWLTPAFRGDERLFLISGLTCARHSG